MIPAHLLVVGALLNSALYLSGCFAAGLMTGNPWAWKMALIALGLTYVGYALQTMQLPEPGKIRWAALVAVVSSITFGVASGITLLVRA